MSILYYNNELFHHGIKGQRWGVRRFQNKNGSLTSEGKKRYSDPDEKQSRYDKLYSKYKTLGYSDSKAKQAANGQLKTERTLKIIGGVALTAVAAYGAYRYYDINVDRTIKPNQMLQTVHKGDIGNRIKPGNPFYASYTKRDNSIYASKVFSHFGKDSNITKMYTNDGIKVASEKTGRKIFDDLVKTDPQMAEYSKRIGHFGKGRKAYERFNYSLVLRNDSDTAKKMKLGDLDHDGIHKKFYDALKKRGYGAVIDVNDSRREGFTFNPVIVFDDQIKHVIGSSKANASQLQGKQFLKGVKWSYARKKTLNPVNKSPAMMVAGYAYLNSVGVATKNNRSLDNKVRYIEQYIKDHPNTTLSNAQIAKMYDKK